MFAMKAYRYVRFRKERKVVDKWRSNVVEIQPEKESEEEKEPAEGIEDVKEEKINSNRF